ncbi:MAG: DUF2283 domain-containing protein, partial [Thermoplasmata archaeon]
YFILDTIIPHIEELEKKLNIEVFSAGRSDDWCLWCIHSKTIDIKINYDKLKKVTMDLYNSLDFNKFKTLDEVEDYLIDQLIENHQRKFIESETMKNFYEGMKEIHEYFTVKVWENEFRKFKTATKSQLKNEHQPNEKEVDMKIIYDPKQNVSYLRLRNSNEEVKTIKVNEEVNIDISLDNKIQGIELLNANEQMKLLDGHVYLEANEVIEILQLIRETNEERSSEIC